MREEKRRWIAGRRGSWRRALPWLVLLAATPVAHAQPAALEFSFSNPGARSLGLGGAFVALADDATAAYANPAGLIQLTRKEISGEFRVWDYSTPFVVGGRLSGEPTGIGLDNTAGLRTENSNEKTSGLSFLSFVYPGKRWSVAVYRHLLADFRASTRTQGFFEDLGGGITNRTEDLQRSAELEIVNYGLSASFRVVDRFSLGFGLSYHVGDLTNTVDFYLPQTVFGPNSYAPDQRLVTQILTIDGTDWAFNFGFLWNFTDRWSLGGVYREAPTFDFVIGVLTGPAFQPPTPENTLVDSAGTKITLPDVYGLGLAFRSTGGAVTASLEWDRVEYSNLIDSIQNEKIDTSETSVDDVDELRVGFEYVFLRTTPVVAARAGVWHDPAHRIHWIGDDLLDQAVFSQGDDEIHFAVGVGLAFKNFQLDLAGDFSEVVDTAALSAIYKF
jgi:long-subunit fatty acid transport protein